MRTLLITWVAVSMSVALAPAQSVPQSADGGRTVAVRMVVTAEPFHGTEVPPINGGDVRALLGKTSPVVTEWVSLQGEMAALELYVLVDERVDPTEVGRFDELRRFIESQAPTTAVGVAYMNNGEARIIQPPTRDHGRAARALRLTTGDDSAAANPFTSLSSLINSWPSGAPRHEAVVISDGVDEFEDVGGASMYLDVAITDAQRAGVQVFCIYAPAAGHSGHSPALIQGGQAYLARIAEETGGEAYYKAGEPFLAFDPYLTDVAEHLAHQFRVTFLAATDAREPTPAEGEGFRRVAFRTQIPNVALVSAHGLYLKTRDSRP